MKALETKSLCKNFGALTVADRIDFALEAGARTTDEILDRAWDDAPIDTVPILRTAAAATLDAHLEKLRAEGRLPG